MARPRKCRKICGMPHTTDFGPRGACQQVASIVMSIDEYETIRLIDLEGLNQEEAAAQMDVARSTIQTIYNTARNKIAQCLVKGIHLRIEGGDIEVCDQSRPCPRATPCTHHRCCGTSKAAVPSGVPSSAPSSPPEP
ncbi:MAG: DUF134 domain-containing protein [Raoultibacter sp.]